MKICLLSWCIVACLLFGWFAQPLAAQEANSKLPLVFSKPYVDFGQAHDGDIVHLEFPFKNKSNRTVYVSRVRPSCMLCTTAKIDNYTVLPGASGLVTATFNTKGMRGQAGKMIYVVTGSVDHEKVYRLNFSGEVLGDVYPIQTAITIDPFREGQVNQMEFSIISLAKTPLEFTSINVQAMEGDPKQIIVKKVAETPIKKFGCSGTEYRFQVTFPADFKPAHSNVSTSVQLKTNNKDYPGFGIGVYGTIPRHVVVSPAAVTADIPPHKPTTINKTITLTNPKHLPIQVLSHQLLFVPTTTITVDPATPDGTVKVHLVIQADGENDREHGILSLIVKLGDKAETDPYTIPLDIYAGPHLAQ